MPNNPYLQSPSTSILGEGPHARLGAAVAAGLFALSLAVALAATVPGAHRSSATLAARDGSHVALATESLELTETVRMAGLAEGQPVDVSLELHAIDAAGRDAGQVASSPSHLRTRAREGSLTVPVTLDASMLAGSTLVALVRVEAADRTLAFEATDIADAAQAVRLPELTATIDDAGDAQDLDEGVAQGVTQDAGQGVAQDADQGVARHTGEDGSQVRATISYANLEPGVRHELTCALVDDRTGAPVAGAGMAAVTFVADARSGTRALTLHVPDRAGTRLRLACDIRPVGGEVCARLGADGPTVGAPVIAATSMVTSTSAADAGVTVTRTVTIDGLEAERPHTLSSVALDADTGEELGSPDGVGTGAEGKAEVELGPAEDSATVTLTYALDEAALGRNVRFQDVLSLDGRVLLRSDGRADGAAAPLPYLRSCASGAHTGMAAEPARADAAVDCTLNYAGLEPGAAYTAQGTLQIVSEDGAGVELAAADGTPVGASADFVATATGSVRLSYALNTSALGASALGASALAGRRLRARERILRDGVVVAETVSSDVSVPSVAVAAADATTGLREVQGSSEATLACHVALEGMPEGEELLAVVSLVDALTGRAATDAAGRAASATRELVATDGRAQADLEVPVDASTVTGELVAVARVEARGCEIASTADTWDEAARVRVPALTCSLQDATTGSSQVAPSRDARLVARLTCGGATEAPHSVELSLVDARTAEPVTDASGTPVRQVLALDTTEALAGVETTLSADTSALAGHTVALEARLMTSGAVTAATGGADPSSCVGVEGDPEESATVAGDGDAGLVATSSAARGGAYGTDGADEAVGAESHIPAATSEGEPAPASHDAKSTPATADATTGAAAAPIARVAAVAGLALTASGVLAGRAVRGARGRQRR